MADEFNRLAASRYADLTRRQFGEDLELSSVSPELGIGIIYEVDRPEWRLHKRELAFWANRAQVAVAGQFSQVGVIPYLTQSAFVTDFQKGPTFITVVTRIVVDRASGNVTVGQLNAPPIAANAPVTVTDNRFAPGPLYATLNGRTLMFNNAQVGQVLPGSGFLQLNAGDELDCEFILFGNNALVAEGTLVNQTAKVCFFGYERPLRGEELLVS